MTDRESLQRLLLERSIERGNFVLASGRRSSYYIDCRRTTMSAEGQVLIGRMGRSAISDAWWQAAGVGGLTMGADPVAYAIAAASYESDHPINAFSVRKQAKEHGTGRQIEGNFQSGDAVVIVEDVITTGQSALQAVSAVEQAGGRVLGVLAVVDREEGGRRAIEARGYQVITLTSVRDLGLGEPP